MLFQNNNNKSIIYISVTLLFFSLLTHSAAQAQETLSAKVEKIYIPINTFTSKEGLGSDNIQDIVQDKRGFLWLATEKGLSRFDSEKFQNFQKNKSNPDSIPDISVEELELMPNGDIWMSVYNVGITTFNPFQEIFKSVKNSDSPLFSMPASTANNVFGIARDKNGHFWMSIYGEGIYQWVPEKNQFIKHLQSNENAWLKSKKTFEIMVDSSNRLWVCTIDSKVFIYEIDTMKVQEFDFSTDPQDPLSSPIYGFAEGSNGQVYAGGYSGVFKYNEIKKDFEHIITKQNIIDIYGERASVRRIMVDSNENVWIGTLESLLHYKGNTLSEVVFYENGNVLDTSWHIHSIIESYDGSLWLGTEGNGLIKMSADWNRFNIYFSKNPEPEDMRRALLYKDNIWIGHPSSKIDLLKLEDNQLRLQKSIQPDLDGVNIRIDSILQDSDDYLWVSSVQGIHKVDIETGESVRVSHPDGQKLGSVRLIHKSGDRYFFNLFSENSIGYFTEEEMIAHMIPNSENNKFEGNMVSQFSQGPDGRVWMSNNRGIQALNPETLKFELIYKISNEGLISSFYFDGETSFWMIIDGALKEFDWNGSSLTAKPDRFENFLPFVNFETIKPLNSTELLITSADSGLIRLDKQSLNYKIYSTINGLPSNEIADLLFPGSKPLIVTELGIAWFRDSFKEPLAVQPKLVIDQLILSDTKLDSETPYLELNHDYGALNFELALLTFTDTENQEFEYKLSGSNEHWVNTGADSRFSFLNLRPGDYEFKVRGRKKLGLWSNEVSFPFHVKSPYWLSGWAYGLYTLTAILVVAWMMYIYRRKVRYELEIDKQLAQKKLAHAESKAKSEFLARVSHEVRTPLNGVLGMGELMLETQLDEEQTIYAQTIVTSGNHLLNVINDILDLSKIEAGKLELEPQEFELSQLLDEVMLSFSSQTLEKGIIFSCTIDPNISSRHIGDTIRIKQILFNLLNNAFKFTDKGSVELKLFQKNEDYIQFQVVDTGVGINTKAIEKLFQPFVQEDSSITRKYGGTGLGLAIVKQLVEKMQGRIRVLSQSEKGTCFEFELMLPSAKEPLISTQSRKAIQVEINDQQLSDSLNSMVKWLSLDTDTNSPKIIITDKIMSSGRSIKSPLSVAFTDPKSNQELKLPVTFRTLMDLTHNELKHIESEELSEPELPTQSLHVLLVEDNPINQHVSLEMVERMGHTIDVVDNVEEALIMLERNKYQILLLDYHLPSRNGLSLFDNWNNPDQIPVIVVTADLTESVLNECKSRKIKHLLAKPFKSKEIRQMINKALEE